MVGVVVHDITDPYFSLIAAGLIEVAETRQLLVCMSSTLAAEAGEQAYVALMRAQRARAVILIGSRSDDAPARDALRAEIAAFTRSGGRVVCVGQDLLGVDTVRPENAAGAQALATPTVSSQGPMLPGKLARYRIERILGTDLSSAESRTSLHVALLALEAARASAGAGPAG